MRQLDESKVHMYELTMKIMGAVLATVIGICGWFLARNVTTIDELNRRVGVLETRLSVLEVMATEAHEETDNINGKLDRLDRLIRMQRTR